MDEKFKGLGLIELLDLLEPLPEPEAVSLWPQTAGWLWLTLLLVAGFGWRPAALAAPTPGQRLSPQGPRRPATGR